MHTAVDSLLTVPCTQVAFEELKSATSQRLQQRLAHTRQRNTRHLLALLALAGGVLWAMRGGKVPPRTLARRRSRPAAAKAPTVAPSQAVDRDPPVEEGPPAPLKAPVQGEGWSRKWQPRWQSRMAPVEDASDMERVTVRGAGIWTTCTVTTHAQQRRRRVAEKVEAFEQAKAGRT